MFSKVLIFAGLNAEAHNYAIEFGYLAENSKYCRGNFLSPILKSTRSDSEFKTV